MSTLPSPIAVFETPDGEVRYRLPRRPFALLRWLGLVPMVLGAFIAGWPIICMAFFLRVGAAAQG